MKTISAPLKTHLATGGPYIMTDLYTITLVGGGVIRLCNFDGDVLWGGNTFLSTGPALDRGKTRIVVGVEVDTLDVKLYPKSTDTLNGIGWQAATIGGALDGATLKLEKAFLNPASSNPAANVIGAVIMFMGRFADVTAGRTEIAIRVNSFLESLNTNMPRNLYQSACMHNLYDSDCGVVRATYSVSGAVLGGSTANSIVCGLAQAAGWFQAGSIKMTSGANVGVSRTIKSSAPGAIKLLTGFPAIPAVGDTFTAYAGCNRSTDCASKFNNILNFKATPYIPVPETAA